MEDDIDEARLLSHLRRLTKLQRIVVYSLVCGLIDAGSMERDDE